MNRLIAIGIASIGTIFLLYGIYTYLIPYIENNNPETNQYVEDLHTLSDNKTSNTEIIYIVSYQYGMDGYYIIDSNMFSDYMNDKVKK